MSQLDIVLKVCQILVILEHLELVVIEEHFGRLHLLNLLALLHVGLARRGDEGGC